MSRRSRSFLLEVHCPHPTRPASQAPSVITLYLKSHLKRVGTESRIALSTHGPAVHMGTSDNRDNQEGRIRRNECPAPLRCLSEPIVKPAPFELTASKILWELIRKELS